MDSIDLIDTHCHLDIDDYDADRDAVIARATAQGVRRIIVPAIDRESGPGVLALAARASGVYAAVGIHPNSTVDFQPAHIAIIEAQAHQPKVIAIGEIGLDYYRDWSPKAQQRSAFAAQLALAARLGLPVIIHDRDAVDSLECSEDILSILEAWVPTLPDALRARPGVLHSFSAPWAIAERALKLGFYLGFTGPLTYKNANDLRLVASRVPTDRLLIETDGPYLTPHPHRGKRNEPAYVRLVAERMATLHNLSLAEISHLTTQNAERLFGFSGDNR